MTAVTGASMQEKSGSAMILDSIFCPQSKLPYLKDWSQNADLQLTPFEKTCLDT